MSQRDQILKSILTDPELMEKYNLSEEEIMELKTSGPFFKKVIEVLSTIINENDNKRSSRQIYSVLKNIHKI